MLTLLSSLLEAHQHPIYTAKMDPAVQPSQKMTLIICNLQEIELLAVGKRNLFRRQTYSKGAIISKNQKAIFISVLKFKTALSICSLSIFQCWRQS